MNINEVGRRALIASIAIVTLFVSACGNESVSGQATAPEAVDDSATMMPVTPELLGPADLLPLAASSQLMSPDSEALPLRGLSIGELHQASPDYKAQGFVAAWPVGSTCMGLMSSWQAVQSDPERSVIRVYGRTEQNMDKIEYYGGSSTEEAQRFLNAQTAEC